MVSLQSGGTELNMLDVNTVAQGAKLDSYELAGLAEDVRNEALRQIAAALIASRSEIEAANDADIKAATDANLSGPLLKRLKFDEQKLADVISGIEGLRGLSDPLGRELLKRELDEGLVLTQVSCPIGVIGVIFESRPDTLVQIAALCVKSGNCALLKGGSEAAQTNKILADIIIKAGISAGLPKNFLTLLESRSEIGELLKCTEYVDLIIPRGSNSFVKYIMDNSDIPVMGHSDGICHVYVDKSANIEEAVAVIKDSKAQYVAACNAVETVLVHKDIAESLLPSLGDALDKAGVLMKGSPRVINILVGADALPEGEGAFRTEYLDYIVSLHILEDLEEAVDHINKYGSHHTDCIITEDDAAAARFMSRVDSAGVYRNCSTRFADGFRYGLGAEVGISTSKLHARGPVGLEGLTTYKYLLEGHGQTVADYAEGRKEFHFVDM
jgi:glutamate-5-semialdehyde dehydrogenase